MKKILDDDLSFFGWSVLRLCTFEKTRHEQNDRVSKHSKENSTNICERERQSRSSYFNYYDNVESNLFYTFLEKNIVKFFQKGFVEDLKSSPATHDLNSRFCSQIKAIDTKYQKYQSKLASFEKYQNNSFLIKFYGNQIERIFQNLQRSCLSPNSEDIEILIGEAERELTNFDQLAKLDLKIYQKAFALICLRFGRKDLISHFFDQQEIDKLLHYSRKHEHQSFAGFEKYADPDCKPISELTSDLNQFLGYADNQIVVLFEQAENTQLNQASFEKLSFFLNEKNIEQEIEKLKMVLPKYSTSNCEYFDRIETVLLSFKLYRANQHIMAIASFLTQIIDLQEQDNQLEVDDSLHNMRNNRYVLRQAPQFVISKNYCMRFADEESCLKPEAMSRIASSPTSKLSIERLIDRIDALCEASISQ